MRWNGWTGILVLAAALGAHAQGNQDPPKPPPAAPSRADPRKVDEAIRKGLHYLRSCGRSPGYQGNVDCDELLALTCLHGGMAPDDAHVRNLLGKILSAKLERIYKVSLQAMFLEELNRVRYQSRIAQCAQFLVDNQCRNGQWSHGEPSVFVETVPTGNSHPREVATVGKGQGEDPPAPGEKKKPRVVRRIAIQKHREGPATGDNSNSQYAALGLRACADAGVILPEEVIQSAERWWRTSAVPQEKPGDPSSVATGQALPAAPLGWRYNSDEGPYGSMTAGAIGALCIYLYLGNKPWKTDKDVLGGLEWLSRNFSVSANPKTPRTDECYSAHYYFLYALERAGILSGTNRLGSHDWYQDGARLLLAEQKPNGSWGTPSDWNPEWATCFAILFLKRATRPLPDIASVDRLSPR